uniref:Ribonuclease H-like domain-containing protein n=1 Tax=Tanacetum cinerariifolium TaxID=118510 RepID=A0A6L2KXT1_TANCI|nr:ribonuclease H-like domain-containing protein [Tanacetum cinerariifolium]
MKVRESLNVTFDESPPPTKLSPLVDDDVGEEEAIRKNTKIMPMSMEIKLTKDGEADSVDSSKYRAKDELRKAYEECRDIPLEQRALIENFLKIEADLDYEMNNDMHDSSQKKYAMKLMGRAHMASCNPTRTPVDTEPKLGADGDPLSDPTLYHNLAGGLQYLTFTRPDISYAVQQGCLYMHDLREPHFLALKRILRYVRSMLDFGLELYASSTISRVAYSDVDWASCPTTRRFTLAETTWLRNLLHELHMPLLSATLVYCNNASAIYLTVNHVQHHQTKHIEIDIHFVRDMVARGHVRVLHVPSRYQYADIFTKGLPSISV